jgi:mRNA interferase MazF
MRRGEVRWYKFGSPDKRRPVVILSRDSTLEFLGEATIAPITRTIRNIPSEVPLSTGDGLPSECAINLDHIQTVTKNKLGARITTLDQDKLEEVRRAISFALGF